MPVVFPDIETASEEGLLAIGGSLDVETLLLAYSKGIFPWPISKDSPMTWFSPDPRGILHIEDYHLSKSFKKFLNKTTYTIKVNRDFHEIIQACAITKRNHEVGTWINKEIITGFTALFNIGHAYCIGIYDANELVGGLYGVTMGKYLTGESMFHKKANASKMALATVMYYLKANQIPFIDTQMVTPIIESLGGHEVPRKEFIKHLYALKSQTLTRDEIFSNLIPAANQLSLL